MLSDPSMIFVTGKGGTGKSTVAAALALSLARQGKRVQMIELAGYRFYGESGSIIGNHAAEFSDSAKPQVLDAIELFQLDPMASLKQFVKRFALFESAANLLLDSQPARSVLNTLPGLKELAIIGKLTHCLEKNLEQNLVPSDRSAGFDVTVVDCFSTGHFLALLRAPKALADAIRSGPMGAQCRKMLRQLQNPALCRYLIITLPEQLPLAESLELSATLEGEFGIAASFLCNKTLGDQFSPAASVPSASAQPQNSEFAAYLNDWRQRQKRVLDQLQCSGSSTLVQQLPYCFEVDLNRQLEVLAQTLTRSLHGVGAKAPAQDAADD